MRKGSRICISGDEGEEGERTGKGILYACTKMPQ
jgi:hypothetical protein